MHDGEASGTTDPITVDLQKMERTLRASPIVSIHRLDKLARMRSTCPTERTIAWLESLIMEMGEQMFSVFAPFMLELLRDEVPPRRRLPDHELRRVAWKVSRCPVFRSLNAKLRNYHARWTPTPCAEVRPHVRDGVHVQGHLRLLGNQHLKHLPLDGEPENVVRLVAVLADLHTFKVSKDSRVLLTSVPWLR